MAFMLSRRPRQPGKGSGIGNAGRCSAYVTNWVERKVRRHLMRATNRPGFGWTRWSTVGLHEALGLFHDYRVPYGARA
jgi:RNA-directed DNA polymerase